MEDKILKAADDILKECGVGEYWLSHQRAEVVKILKQLVEGVREHAPNSQREAIATCKCGSIIYSEDDHTCQDGEYYCCACM